MGLARRMFYMGLARGCLHGIGAGMFTWDWYGDVYMGLVRVYFHFLKIVVHGISTEDVLYGISSGMFTWDWCGDVYMGLVRGCLHGIGAGIFSFFENCCTWD